MQKRFTISLARTIIVISLVFINIGCDQVTKQMARDNLSFYEPLRLRNSRIGVMLTNVENSGAFLSLGENLGGPVRTFLMEILPLVILLVGFLFLIFTRKIDRVTLIASCFIIGGGAGNLYDRIRYGSVTDFVHLDFRIFQTGIFNMADVSIMVGVFAVLIKELFFRRRSEPSAS